MFQVPRQYSKYEQRSGDFITHYGEIYPGTIMHCPNYEDGIFIVANHNLNEFNNLKAEERTPENYRKFGWEIRDFKIIDKAVDRLFPEGHQDFHAPPLDINPGEYKRMFVFGAAASKYCLYDEKLQQNLEREYYCPPLGTEIFDERFDGKCRSYPGVLQSMDEWDIAGRDIEQFLEEQWQFFRFQFDPAIPNRHINIQFYLQDLFIWISNYVMENYRRTNLYNTLIEKIRRQNIVDGCKTAYVSFNYDTILDRFIEGYYQHEFRDTNLYLGRDFPFALFKPHGSSNWGFRMPQENIPGGAKNDLHNWLFKNHVSLSYIYFHIMGEIPETLSRRSYGEEMGLNPENKMSKYTIDKDRMQVLPADGWRNNYFPALLMPYRDKDEFVMPYRHQLGLRLICAEVEELYLIGWKGNETLFNLQFKRGNKLKRIIIVNPEPEVVKQHLSSYVNLDKIEVLEIPTFKSFVLEHLNNCLNGIG